MDSRLAAAVTDAAELVRAVAAGDAAAVERITEAMIEPKLTTLILAGWLAQAADGQPLTAEAVAAMVLLRRDGVV